MGERLLPAEVAVWHNRFGAELKAFLRTVLRDSDLADEAFQNTFQRALEVGHNARQESIKGWLFKVAFHEALALKRRSAARGRTLQQYTQHAPELSNPTPKAGLPEAQILRQETLTRVAAALAQLPAEQRFVVEQRIYHADTFATIAATQNVPLGTVLTRMRLALQKLSIALREQDR